MENISYEHPCNSNKDCDSNVCELIYENDKPKGRYCLMNTNNKYTKSCKSNKDCNSGNCEKIYDNDGKYLTRKCVKAPKIDRDTSFNSLFGKERSNEYGLMNENTIALKIGDKGPITEIMFKIFSIVGNFFNIIFINLDVCGDNKRRTDKKCSKGKTECCGNVMLTPFGKCKAREGECSMMSEKANNGILYGIWLTIFDAIFGNIMKNFKRGLIWGGIQKKYHDDCKGKCKGNSKGIDLWYLRVVITILFPPFGVFLSKGLKGMVDIIICGVLTSFFYFPGLIYAITVINSTKREQTEQRELSKIYNSQKPNKSNK